MMPCKVSLRFRGLDQRPPPFLDLLVEVEVVNSTDEPCWVLLPLYLDPSTDMHHLLVSSVEICELSGSGRVLLARALGKGSFQTLRAGPSTHTAIDKLPITLVGELPNEISVPVVTARVLRIAETLGESWFARDLLSSADARVSYEPGAVVATQDVPGGEVLPVTTSGGETRTVRLVLDKR